MKKIIFLALIFSLLMCGCSNSGASTDITENKEVSSFNDDRTYTIDRYMQIQLDHSYDDVTAIMKSPGDASVDGEVLKQYLWENEDGSNISVTFYDGRVTAKTQAYLGTYLEGNKKVDMKMFHKLREGSDLSTVEDILGQGTEMMRQKISGVESVTYIWSNSDGSGISIIFEDGKATKLNDIMLK